MEVARSALCQLSRIAMAPSCCRKRYGIDLSCFFYCWSSAHLLVFECCLLEPHIQRETVLHVSLLDQIKHRATPTESCCRRIRTMSSSPPSSTSSLSLLLPPTAKEEGKPSLEVPDQKFSQTSAGSELETLTRTVIDALNARSYQPIHNLVADKYMADLDDISQVNSYDQNVTQFSKMSSTNPNYRLEVLEVQPDVDEENGFAIGTSRVWDMKCRVGGR